MVQIIKFANDWVTFEHKGKCYSINSDHELDSKEIAKIEHMSFDEVKAKYDLTWDSDDSASDSQHSH